MPPPPAAASPGKDELRRTARAVRAAIAPAEAAAAAEALSSRFFTALAPGPVAIGGYWPMSGEIDVRPLLARHRADGGVTALPAVEIRDASLRFHAWDGETPTRRDALGLACAAGEALVPRILLVPLLSFDRAGHRLGYGGGYYDRTLGALRAGGPVTAVGVGFACQEVPALAAEPHDAHLDWIVTDTFAFPVKAA